MESYRARYKFKVESQHRDRLLKDADVAFFFKKIIKLKLFFLFSEELFNIFATNFISNVGFYQFLRRFNFELIIWRNYLREIGQHFRKLWTRYDAGSVPKDTQPQLRITQKSFPNCSAFQTVP